MVVLGSTLFPMADSVLVWNVRGLNVRSHHDVVCVLVVAERPSLACLQETKLVVISNSDIMQMLSAGFEYVFLPAYSNRGGVLLTWLSVAWSISNSSLHRFLVSIKLLHASFGLSWSLTTVYGLSRQEDKDQFL
jgi:exonuclease III